MRDLVVLVPDRNTEHVVIGALSRPQALGIRPIDFSVNADPGRDGGVRRRGVQILNVGRSQFRHALMILDYEGSGATERAYDLEATLDAALSHEWSTNAKTIVVESEVDVWMWGAETYLKAVVRWRFSDGIRDWLRSELFSFGPSGKPDRPKEAMDAVCRRAQVPRSSATYKALSKRISLRRCEDRAFRRLREQLVEWFGEGS